MEFMMTGGPAGNVKDDYMVRTQAWRWLHYVMAWKLASRHPLGLARADVQDSFALHLEQIYKQVYIPQVVRKVDDRFFNGLRNLGQPMMQSPFNNNELMAQGGGLGYYMGHVLQLMKQTGMWAAMMARGGHIRDVLLLQVRNMDQYALGLHADTTATIPAYMTFSKEGVFPSSMVHYQELYGAKNEEMFTDASGKLIGDREVAIHPIIQYIHIRRDYFPEIPHPKLASAIARLNERLALVTAAVAAETEPAKKRERDHTYRYPGLAPIKASAELGAPAPLVKAPPAKA